MTLRSLASSIKSTAAIQGAALALALAFAWTATAVPASAQLVLPKPSSQPAPERPPSSGRPSSERPVSKPKGNIAPYHSCVVCGERNYNAPRGSRVLENGNIVAWCMRCKRDTEQKNKDSTTEGVGLEKRATNDAHSLHLPPASSAPASSNGMTGGAPRTTGTTPTSGAHAADGAPTSEHDAANATPNSNGASAGSASLGSATNASAVDTSSPPPPIEASAAANAVFDRVARSKALGGPIADDALVELASLGDSGLAAARDHLASPEPAVALAAGRALARSGRADEVERVMQRVRDKTPSTVGAMLVDELAAADPVRTSPRFLAELLDHPQAPVRSAAHKHLARSIDASTLSVIAPVLDSKRADGRVAAVELVGSIDGEEASALLLNHLADPTAKVASAVVTALAGRNDDDLDARLASLAFRERWILRTSAYALIALIEREDLRLHPVLEDSQVEPLLAGADSKDPFISGACAAALAGIGFRSRAGGKDTWLDRDVIDRLVFTVSGKEFHNDFTALAAPALRRLKLVTGEDFATNGPAWVQWWVSARPKFTARRAYITYGDEDLDGLSVTYLSGKESASRLVLLGPALLSTAAARAIDTEVVVLGEGEARDLAAVMERESLFGPEHLPGTRGKRSGGARTLDVTVAGRTKVFTMGEDLSEPWFDRSVEAVLALRDRNRWQSYVARPTTADDVRAWNEQAAWWRGERGDLERALRLKTLVISALGREVPALRDAGLNDVARLYADSRVPASEDFVSWMRLLGEESIYGPRVHALASLALEAASVVRNGAGSNEGPIARASLPGDRATEVVALLSKKFGNFAREDLLHAIQSGGAEFELAMAAHADPLVRALSADALAARLSSGAEVPFRSRAEHAILALLDDHDPNVEVAAALALGKQKVEAARTELLVRARLGRKPVRIAALKAIGILGGDFVFEALMLGLGDLDADIKVAAAEGLALSSEPAAVQVLVSLLAEGPNSPAFDVVKKGLARAGTKAVPDLLRALNSGSAVTKREAALCLSEMCAPDAASVLMSCLSSTPADAHVASELAVLTGIDFRASPDPAGAWWDWWDGVVHDNALSWFCAALERAGLTPPAMESFGADGSREARLFLLQVLARDEPYLCERARRELERMLHEDLEALPPRGPAREQWIADLSRRIEAPRER